VLLQKYLPRIIRPIGFGSAILISSPGLTAIDRPTSLTPKVRSVSRFGSTAVALEAASVIVIIANPAI
jgi:hypothetical protein